MERETRNQKKWGWDYLRIIKEYFGDIYIVLENVGEVLKEA